MIRRRHRYVLVLFSAFFLTSFLKAQERDFGSKLDSPMAESFELRDHVLAPARDAVCPGIESIRTTNCPIWPASEYVKAHRLTLYNNDGSEWRRFSLKSEEPDYFVDVKDLVPLGSYRDSYPTIILLRLVAESEHWYKVEVNEKTREMKYALKNDPLWAKTGWYTWLNNSLHLVPDFSANKLRKRPDGEVVDNYENGCKSLRFLEVDGDWIKGSCKISEDQQYVGWIRWRVGRDIIVGWMGNRHRSPSGYEQGENEQVRP